MKCNFQTLNQGHAYSIDKSGNHTRRQEERQAGEVYRTTFCINLQPTKAVSVSASSNPLTGTKHNDCALHQTCSFFLAFLPGNRIMQEAAMHSLFPTDYQLHCSVDAAPRSIIVLGSFKLKPSVKCPVFIC
jgi:hypothetical protein